MMRVANKMLLCASPSYTQIPFNLTSHFCIADNGVDEDVGEMNRRIITNGISKVAIGFINKNNADTM